MVLDYYNCNFIVTVACIHSKQLVSDFVLLQLVVRGLLSSLKSIGSILFYDLLIITVFAVIGTQIFKVLVLHVCDTVLNSCESGGHNFLCMGKSFLSRVLIVHAL